jgi:PAS domain S-box-containing protein
MFVDALQMWFWLSVYSPERGYFVAVFDVITERKLAEFKLRGALTEAQNFREALDQVSAYIYMKDTQSRYVYANRPTLKLFGCSAEELVGCDDTRFFPPDAVTRLRKVDSRVLLGERTAEEIDVADAEGGRHVYWEVKTPIYVEPESQTIGGLLGISTDITERKRAEEEKAKLEGHLHQSQKMEAIGTLAGGIAHDFNNVLAAIIGYTEMAMEEEQNEIQRRYLQETLKGAERAKNLVRQILSFSRQDGREKKPLDLKLLLKEAVKFLRASIPATVEIRQHLIDESCNIMADPTQMHQIIMNLCTNAAQAMKRTGGLLKIELATIELAQGEIPHHHDLKPGHYLKLTVSDTGHGIEPALQLRIFDPFFTTKSKEEGTGLGLSVVFGIVKSHGGVITVYSEPGQGASFSVYLPRIIHKEAINGTLSGPVIGGTERILLVDDEPALVEMGTLMLSPLGYEVTGVTSSREALDLFRAEPERFDLVITDMTLPKMTGLDLSREMLQIRPDLPIVLCSGIRESGTEKQVKSLGIKAYCIKPLTRIELSRVIRKVLDGH